MLIFNLLVGAVIFSYYNSITAKQQNIIDVHYNYYNTLYQIQCNIGTPSQDVLIMIDITSEINVLSPFAFDAKASRTLSQDNRMRINIQHEKRVLVDLARDKLYLHNSNNNTNDSVNISKFMFYYILIESSIKYNSIGLAMNYNEQHNTQFNIVSMLYQMGYINDMSFCLFEKTKYDGIWYIGGLPLETIKQEKLEHHIQCTGNTQAVLWNCKLNGVVVGDKVVLYDDNSTSNYIALHNNDTYILCPNNVYVYIHDIMMEYVQQGICTNFTSTNGRSRYNVVCPCNLIKNFPNITLIINNYEMVLTYKEMFDDLIGQCFFNIESYPTTTTTTTCNNTNTGNNWLLGKTFISKYIPIFHYTNKSLSFYSSTPFPQVHHTSSSSSSSLTLFLYKLLYILLLISTLPNIIILININKINK